MAAAGGVVAGGSCGGGGSVEGSMGGGGQSGWMTAGARWVARDLRALALALLFRRTHLWFLGFLVDSLHVHQAIAMLLYPL